MHRAEDGNVLRIMFAILKDGDGGQAPYEAIYFDLLSETESEREFERLQRVEVRFSGYLRSTDGAPDGLAPNARARIAELVGRMNRGEEMGEAQIRSVLASVLI